MVRASGPQGGSRRLAVREPPHRTDREVLRLPDAVRAAARRDALRHPRRGVPDHPHQPRRAGGVHRHDAAGQQPDRQRRMVGTARGHARATPGTGPVGGHRRHRARDRSLACALGARGNRGDHRRRRRVAAAVPTGPGRPRIAVRVSDPDRARPAHARSGVALRHVRYPADLPAAVVDVRTDRGIACGDRRRRLPLPGGRHRHRDHRLECGQHLDHRSLHGSRVPVDRAVAEVPGPFDAGPAAVDPAPARHRGDAVGAGAAPGRGRCC